MNYLDTVQNFKYKDYKINYNHNLMLYKELENIYDISKKNNLNFLLTGSWALLFHTDKLFRTLTDIDLIIKPEQLINWINILKFRYEMLFLDHPVKFFENCLKSNNLLPFKNKENNIKIEISIYHPNKNILQKNINNRIYQYFLPLKIKKIPGFFYDRPKDNDDIDFYSKYIN